jgi:hypothetical protein
MPVTQTGKTDERCGSSRFFRQCIANSGSVLSATISRTMQPALLPPSVERQPDQGQRRSANIKEPLTYWPAFRTSVAWN